jgi:hypothetical protein
MTLRNAAKLQVPERFFNIAGPNVSEDHYMLDPLRRINYDEVSRLIRQKQYFVLHAPRQTGKTTSLLAMARKINEEGQYRCAYMNVESAQTARNDVETGMKAILSAFCDASERFLDIEQPVGLISSFIEERSAHYALKSMLGNFCKKLDQPLVLFIDEIDALIGDTLTSVLRQLRSGYESRPRAFPMSVVLCGVRDVRDYRIHMFDGAIITGGSCFNIKAESLRLGDFSQEDIRELYEQHMEETGQIFEEDIYPVVWDLTHGQPWLVNALARQATAKIPEGRDRNNPITLNIIEQAAEALILERATHLDQLAEKLREDRVRRVIAPMIAGEHWPLNGDEPQDDDIQYVIDLGLLRRDGPNAKTLVISNAMYMEIIPRELVSKTQYNLVSRAEQPWYVESDGRLDISKLLRDFQQFFRENIDSWKESYDYKEAGFQLLLQAFLQRIVNGGGRIEREYALGRGRVDLLVRWRHPGTADRREQEEQRIVLELKTIRASSHDPNKALSEGLDQTARYAEGSNAAEAHLIICDERAGRGWDEKIYERLERNGTRDIHIWGM